MTTTATRASTILTQGSDHYPSQYFCDVRASYQLGKQGEGWRRAFGDMELSCGVQNAFNRDLLIRAGTIASLGYLPVDDPRLRRYSLNLEKRFLAGLMQLKLGSPTEHRLALLEM